MRRLTRGPSPGCLQRYSAGSHGWNDVTAADRAEIWRELEAMQGRRCAYCEGGLDALGRHIEHFRRKASGHFPHLTFEWSNLYGSCDQYDSCGHFKDHGAGSYSPDDLVDPCQEAPDGLLRFRSNGTVAARRNLSAAQQHRAAETLRVFKLDPERGRLRNMRKAAVAGYVKDAEDAVVAGLSAADLHEYFADELEETASLPFSTAIRHVLTEP